jgi:hypothetical protein
VQVVDAVGRGVRLRPEWEQRHAQDFMSGTFFVWLFTALAAETEISSAKSADSRT